MTKGLSTNIKNILSTLNFQDSMCFSVWSSLYHVKLNIVNKLSLKEETASLGEKKISLITITTQAHFWHSGRAWGSKGLWTECPQREGRSSWDAWRHLGFKCCLFHNVISSPLSSFLEKLMKSNKKKIICAWSTEILKSRSHEKFSLPRFRQFGL